VTSKAVTRAKNKKPPYDSCDQNKEPSQTATSTETPTDNETIE
jgi:hypothetical protein